MIVIRRRRRLKCPTLFYFVQQMKKQFNHEMGNEAPEIFLKYSVREAILNIYIDLHIYHGIRVFSDDSHNIIAMHSIN